MLRKAAWGTGKPVVPRGCGIPTLLWTQQQQNRSSNSRDHCGSKRDIAGVLGMARGALSKGREDAAWGHDSVEGDQECPLHAFTGATECAMKRMQKNIQACECVCV